MTTYRPATRDELGLAVGWAAAEGWNPGLGDGDAFWATDPDGYVCVERDGDVVATGSVVSYDGAFGFMGFFIVRPELRGQGIGRDFWSWRRDRLRDRLGVGAAIGMDGVLAMEPFYARGGFVLAHRNVRMAGTGRPGRPRSELVPASDVDEHALAQFDARHFGFRRDVFLRHWLAAPGVTALARVVDGTVRGFGVLRPCRSGHKIGPLFADEPEVAEDLFVALSDAGAGEPIFLDVPDVNTDAVALADRHGLVEEFACARMYHGIAPALPWRQIYGVTSFELG